MSAERRMVPGFLLAGIGVRTTNQGGQSQQDIGYLWKRFHGERIADKIPDRADDDVYCLYTDYEDGVGGHYTTIIGCQVNSLDNIPESLIGKKIPTADYQVYVSVGAMPEALIRTWTQIWESGIQRAFGADFDVYGKETGDPQHALVKTYLSVK